MLQQVNRFRTDFADSLILSDCADYSTSDGIHLTKTSADKYQRYLQAEMRALMNRQEPGNE